MPTARVHHARPRRDGSLAARGARLAKANHRFSQYRILCIDGTSCESVPAGASPAKPVTSRAENIAIEHQSVHARH